MAISVGTAQPGRISGVGYNYGQQGSSYSPQAPSNRVIQGSSPNLQATYNPQVVATFNQQRAPTRLSQIQSAASSGSVAVDESMRKWQELLRTMSQPPVQPRAAAYDIAGANARARASAESSQNPLYSKYLTDFLTNARLQQQQEEQKAQMANKALETELAQTKEDTATTGARTAEDVTSATNQINTAADEFQTDSGTRFAIDRIEEARTLSKSGLSGGLGAQKAEASQTARNTTEKRQTAKFDEAKLEQQVFKARKFEDLATIEKRATETEKTGKERTKFDLDTYISQYGVGKDIQSSGAQVKKFADVNEQNRQEAIADAAKGYASQYFNEFIARLSNPGQISATRAKYGGAY